MESSKEWFSFVNENPNDAQKLVLIIFCGGWLGWKWITTWKIGKFFQVPPVYCREVVKKLLIVCSSPNKSLDISFSVL